LVERMAYLIARFASGSKRVAAT